MMYQKCPVCDGTGLVSKPPGIAGDQEVWDSADVGPYTCRVCLGKGIILTPTEIKLASISIPGEGGLSDATSRQTDR